MVPPEANFVMIPFAFEEDAVRFTEDMLREGIIVLHLRPFGLPQCVRISTGTDEMNRACVQAAQKVLATVRV